MSEQYTPKHNMKTYANIFGGVFDQILSTPGFSVDDTKDLYNTSEYLIPAIKYLDQLIDNRLEGANTIDDTLRAYINSPVLDALYENSIDTPIMILATHNFLAQLKYVILEEILEPEIEDLAISFTIACEKGYLEMAVWLYEKYKFPIFESTISLFRHICLNGRLNVANWFYQTFSVKDTDIILPNNINSLFCDVCHDGHLDLAKWLLESFSHIDIRYNDDVLFNNIFMSSSSGALVTIKWLLSVCPDLDIHNNEENAFRESIIYGNKETVEWLLSTFSDINVHACEDQALKKSCQDDELEKVKILCNYYTEEEHKNALIIAFIKSRRHRSNSVTTFLISKYPFLYNMLLTERDTINEMLENGKSV